MGARGSPDFRQIVSGEWHTIISAPYPWWPWWHIQDFGFLFGVPRLNQPEWTNWIFHFIVNFAPVRYGMPVIVTQQIHGPPQGRGRARVCASEMWALCAPFRINDVGMEFLLDCDPFWIQRGYFRVKHNGHNCGQTLRPVRWGDTFSLIFAVNSAAESLQHVMRNRRNQGEDFDDEFGLMQLSYCATQFEEVCQAILSDGTYHMQECDEDASNGYLLIKCNTEPFCW